VLQEVIPRTTLGPILIPTRITKFYLKILSSPQQPHLMQSNKALQILMRQKRWSRAPRWKARPSATLWEFLSLDKSYSMPFSISRWIFIPCRSKISCGRIREIGEALTFQDTAIIQPLPRRLVLFPINVWRFATHRGSKPCPGYKYTARDIFMLAMNC